MYRISGDALTSPKSYIRFTEQEGAEEQCQCGAPALSNQRIFDWLDHISKNATLEFIKEFAAGGRTPSSKPKPLRGDDLLVEPP
jgi:hypothetical protein